MKRPQVQIWVTTFIVALATPVFAQAPEAKSVSIVPSDRIFADGFELFTLTINNYFSWCSVSVNGGVASSAATISQAFPAGTLVPLHGDAVNATFVWGYWIGTDGGNPNTSMDATVTMSTDRSVQACCPIVGTTTCP